MAKRQQCKSNTKRAGAGNTLPVRAAVSDLVRPRNFRFAAAFALCSVGLYAVINTVPDSLTRPLNGNVAAMLGLVLSFIGLSVSVAGDIVSGYGLAFRIIPECTPVFTSGLFLSFVIFCPSTLRQKFIGVLMGIPALYLGNLVRLAVTFEVSRYDRNLFEIFHVYLGQVFTIFIVIAACMIWIKWTDKEKTGRENALNAAIFFARLFVISGCLFFVWMKFHHWYIWLLDKIMFSGFSLFGYSIRLAGNNMVYYETFSIVVFTSLVLAVSSKSWTMKFRWLAAGVGFLFLTHLFHRIDNALIAYFNVTSALAADLTLLVIGQYLLPVLLLILLVSKSGLATRTHDSHEHSTSGK